MMSDARHFVTGTFVDGVALNALGLEDLLIVFRVFGRSFIEQQKLEAIDGSSVMVGLEWGHDKVKDTRGRVRDWKFNLVINLKDDFYKVVIVSLK